MGRGLIFLYRYSDGFILSEKPLKILAKDYKKLELLVSFSSVKNAGVYIAKKKLAVLNLCKYKRDLYDEDAREKMRQMKLGELNPNSKGLSEKHRRNIGKSMKGKNLSQFNVNFGKPRTRTVRAKISHTKLKNNAQVVRRWALDELGNETIVTLPFVLPIGWSWGRKRSSLRKKR